MEEVIKILNSRFQADLAFIEKAENYYVMFRYVIESCARAELENLLLYSNGDFSDEKYIEYVSRIHTAKKRAIVTHGEWAIKMLEHSATQHTPRTFVSSIYSDIFNIVLKPKDDEQ